MTQDLAALVAQATPGPWAVEGVRHSGDLKIGPNTRLHFVGPDDDAVAAVFFDMKTGQGLPDAKLIAMAPDLARTVLEQQAEIARLTAKLAAAVEVQDRLMNERYQQYLRAEKAEAALTESQAREAAAYEVAAGLPQDPNWIWRFEPRWSARDLSDAIRALTPAEAQAALDARDKAKVEEGRIMGLREAADLCKPKKAKTDWGNRWTPATKNPQSAAAQGARRQCYDAILAKIKEAENG